MEIGSDVEEPVCDADEVVADADAAASVLGGRVYDDGVIGRHEASVASARVRCTVRWASWVMFLE
ncbi:hypothetical protein M2158_005694 [Streptomyces sp. SAI-144]|nr:hypothetical protein [Streptomyces sp. SAI-144]MDH6484578.1 hypothetical protein [Streptomyces sp. SAI-127]